jgi:hypothetical protein
MFFVMEQEVSTSKKAKRQKGKRIVAFTCLNRR